jgi:hypothetical protein
MSLPWSLCTDKKSRQFCRYAGGVATAETAVFNKGDDREPSGSLRIKDQAGKPSVGLRPRRIRPWPGASLAPNLPAGAGQGRCDIPGGAAFYRRAHRPLQFQRRSSLHNADSILIGIRPAARFRPLHSNNRRQHDAAIADRLEKPRQVQSGGGERRFAKGEGIRPIFGGGACA